MPSQANPAGPDLSQAAEVTEAPRPTETPKPTPKPSETPVPEPTRDPDDPIPTPAPETDPTPVESGEPFNPSPPHPDGLEGCRSLNLWSDPYDHIIYHSWCADRLMVGVHSQCSGIGTGEEQQACAVEWLADVQSYLMREFSAPCIGAEDRAQCADDMAVAMSGHFRDFNAAWNSILIAVTDDGDVKARFARMNTCVEDLGYEALDPNIPPPWQQINPDNVEVKPNRTASEQEALAAHIARLRAVHQCSLASGLYEMQDTKWQSEIQDLLTDAPEQAEAMKNEGIIEILEEPGAAPFLTLRGLN